MTAPSLPSATPDDPEATIRACLTALAANPSDAALQDRLGVAYRRRRRYPDAAAAFLAATGADPAYRPAYLHFGEMLAALEHHRQAAEAFRQALKLAPDDAGVMLDLALAEAESGNLAAARSLVAQAAARAPANPRAFYVLGVAFKAEGRLAEAVEAYRRAIAADPQHLPSYSKLIYTASLGGLMPQEEILRYAVAFDRAARGGSPVRPRPPAQARSGRIHVGFISAEIGYHAVSCFLESYLRHYDRARIHVTLYPTTEMHDRERLLALADATRELTGLDDAEARAVLDADAPDILVDTTSHMRGSRLPLLAQRCAPVQCHYIGFHGSTGLAAMDYFIGDDEITPPAFAAHFSETLFRLPRLWVAYTPLGVLPAPGPPQAGEGLVLGCFNNLGKVSDACLALWGRALAAVPSASLLLKDKLAVDPTMRSHVLERLAASGIAPDRVTFAPPTPDWAAHMAMYERVDIALDTWPLNSGTTGFDALMMGTPLITLRGDWMGGRMSSAVLKALGRADWIAATADDYVAIVARLAGDLAALRGLRPGLRQAVAQSALCDARSLAAALDDAFVQMHATARAARA